MRRLSLKQLFEDLQFAIDKINELPLPKIQILVEVLDLSININF